MNWVREGEACPGTFLASVRVKTSWAVVERAGETGWLLVIIEEAGVGFSGLPNSLCPKGVVVFAPRHLFT